MYSFKIINTFERHNLKEFIWMMLLVTLLFPGKNLFGKYVFQPQMHSEAPIIFIDGIKMAPQLTVHFKCKVFDLPSGITTASINNIDLSYSNVLDYFLQLEQKSGKILFRKQIPNAQWGDTLRTGRRTGKQVRIRDMSQLFAVRFPQFVAIDSIITELEQMDEVLYAHQPIQTIPLIDPNDPFYNSTDQWNLFKIEASQAWGISQGSSNITVGIVEDAMGLEYGVPDRNHVDLAGKFVPGLGNFSIVPGEHATQVAGIIGAATDNNTGIASLGWNIMMIPYRFLRYEEQYPNDPDCLPNVITTAVNDGCDVINCSFVTRSTTVAGGTDCIIYEAKNYPSVENAIINAINQEVVVVAGTGNTGWELTNQVPDCIQYLPIDYTPYPAAYDGVIGVSATDVNDNFGMSTSGVPYNQDPEKEFIDLAAPGIDILTTNSYDTYDIVRGTSFSSPHVAALAGLILSINGNLIPSEVQQIIIDSAIDLNPPGRDRYFGFGRINAYKTVKHPIVSGFGHIKSSFTLFSDITIKGDIIVDQGATLTIKPGVTLTFAANSDAQNEGIYSTLSELIVKGKVVFEGSAAESIVFQSTSGQPQSWGGIRFEDSSDDFSVITHCQIEDAFIGLHLDRAGTSVNDNTLINNMWGLYLNYSAASINNNLIRDNTSNGLLIYNSNAIEQDVLVENNTIIFNGARGIYGNNSSPIITKNFIKHNNLHGIEGLNQFNAIIGSRAGQDNWISNNSGFGIRIMNASTPFLGNDEESPGQNAVYNNGNAEFYNTGGSICYAQYNYWGADPPEEEEFYTDAASEIIYNPWLSENPMMELKLTKNNSVNSQNFKHFSQDSTGNDFQQFFRYYFSGQFQSAISLAINIINQYPRNSQIPNLLGVLWRAYIKVQNVPDFKIILSKIINKHPELPIKGWAQIILALIMTGNKDYGTALGLFELAASGFPSSGVEATAIYGQFYIYFLEIFDHVMAQNKLHELQQKYPDDPLTQNAEELFAAFPFGGVNRSMRKNSTTNQLPAIPSHFELLQNYPNPFNPETNIAFQLPTDNHIYLEIYDLNGRRVKTLFNNQINEGTHHVKWDGTDDSGKQVASGIYIYRLKSGRLIQSRKMLLIR